MSKKDITLNQKISNILHLFFDSNIDNFNLKKIKKIEGDPNLNVNYELINNEDINELNKIFKKKNKINYKLLKLNYIYKDEAEEEEIEDINKDNINEYDEKYISFQRKAFIKWLNEDYYQNIINITKTNNLKIYQNFVKEYLSFKSPYRGLLVYHGLGTGKTATAISTAEGLSKNMNITTLLPASLETEFIKEVKVWGDELFNRDNNNWVFISYDIIISKPNLRKKLYDRYKITTELIDKIHNKIKDTKKGFWDISYGEDEIEDIKTKSGYFIKNGKNTDIKVGKLNEIELRYIDIQNTELIKQKYNFIHYNPFPKVQETNIKDFLYKENDNENNIYYDFSNDIDYKTYNQKIVKKLESKLKENQSKYYIDSPFNDETIIIDEVHNFVREIVNNSGPSRIFYNWILNSRNIKLICLSGTPIINKPSEIAILFNMIRGINKIYTFIININEDSTIIYNKLKEIFYENTSPIYQIYVTNFMGKLCISFMKNTARFESIMNPQDKIVYTVKHNDYDFDDFINYIYKGLNKLFKKEAIIPSEDTFQKLSKEDKIFLIKGGIKNFDKTINIPFVVHRELFTINDNKNDIDLTDNNNFMNYFFDESLEIPTNKKALLKRMIIGLASYYPIDRSSIISMPEIIKPNNIIYDNINYSEYNISKKNKVELCLMSQRQFDKYESAWLQEKDKNIKMSRNKMYSNDNSDYHIRTRQACNMVYSNDNFRKINKKINKTEFLKEKEIEYNLLAKDEGLSYKNTNLKKYSPKFFKLYENMTKFIANGISTGKILFYSEFRGDAGSEIFELILKSNGYNKYDINDTDKSKKLRYTFITGFESQDERKLNKEAYNDEANKYGEFIQVMIISGAGAEGISLKGVRQVHILEPYWNYVRIDQVYGRAIRLESHDQLEPNNRNVEEYIYLSVFPMGNNIIDLYKNLKDNDTWDIPKIEYSTNEELKDLLFNNYKQTYDLLNNLVRIKTESLNNTLDQNLFNMMEKKYNIATKINDLIKEASVDCIQNTRDDISINQNCLRYDDKLLQENSYFPGISAETLSNIDNIQLQSRINVFINPDIHVISGLEKENEVFLYTKFKNNDNNDIRYIRENSKTLGIFYLYSKFYYRYIFDEHELDSLLGNKLSVFQEIYLIDQQIINDVINSIDLDEKDIPFPPLSKLLNKSNLIGYKIKYNITEEFFYMPLKTKKHNILRIYPFDECEQLDFLNIGMEPFLISNKKIYKLK